MKVLGVDAATDICGVALMEDGHLLCEYRLKTGFFHAEHLLLLIDRVLKDQKLELADLDGLALTIGPGSFTGLRVALSTVKGLLAGSDKPVVAVSTLEALAWNLPMASDPICTLLDAKKQEVYAALFAFEESGELKRLMDDQVISPATLLERLSGRTLFIGEGAHRYRNLIVERLGRRARFAPPSQQASKASIVAQIGLERLRQGLRVDIKTLTPNYLRCSDAEVNLEKRQREKNEAGHDQ
jgi:tRNA threonylcarbamoyladenosine biosynthesis protein TsaB